MSAFAKIAFVAIAVTLALAPCQRSNADLMLLTVRAAKECPDGLTIKSKAGKDGMIQFDVYVHAEEIAHADEAYKGRVKAHAVLNIATAEAQVASVVVHGSAEGKRTWYQFRLAPSAAKTSELQLGVSLYEKDGMPTIGGGVSMQVHLAGFVPNTEDTDKGKVKH
jgi:hypothetical protein